MAEPEALDEDLFADLYDGDEAPAKSAQPAAQPVKSEQTSSDAPAAPSAPVKTEPMSDAANGSNGNQDGDVQMNGNWKNEDHSNDYGNAAAATPNNDDNYGPIGIKEDGGKRHESTWFAPKE
ncbi:hypothetical protein K490DRAFT_60202 [Saccharata proteae CBS 121410]|uniref:Uncharacterized protein n=1 Tax=Saccharata proteae CBS 121410 TaxID=1314787 RepID=A0A9P4LU49_9PEZI|nr:hypothetical protein K490DRAFT_60202 [Saccharata proteae CBS 121410]